SIPTLPSIDLRPTQLYRPLELPALPPILHHTGEEVIMTRKYIDCREFPSETRCTVTIAADSENELLDVAVQHAVAVHGHQDTQEFRQQLREAIHEGKVPD